MAAAYAQLTRIHTKRLATTPPRSHTLRWPTHAAPITWRCPDETGVCESGGRRGRLWLSCVFATRAGWGRGGCPRQPSHQGYILSRALPEVINPQCRTSTLKSNHPIQSCFFISLPCSSSFNGTNQLVDFSRLSRSDIYTRGRSFSLVALPLFAALFLTTSPSV